MSDTKKGGNSIVWSWREVAVENCTCMSVRAGMYCGPERTPGYANDSPVESSCGSHCWDLGYVDAETEYFISKGFPVCGGPVAPPTPDPILWPEFPLNNLNRDGVPPCQQRATAQSFKQNIYVRVSEQQQVNPPKPVILNGDPGKCDREYKAKVDAADAKAKACAKAAGELLTCALGGPCAGAAAGYTPCVTNECKSAAEKVYRKTMTGSESGDCDSGCQRAANDVGDTNPYDRSCEGAKANSDYWAINALKACIAAQGGSTPPSTSAEM